VPGAENFRTLWGLPDERVGLAFARRRPGLIALLMLKRRYWRDFASFADLLDQVQQPQANGANVVAKTTLTFDAGNASDVELVLPELVKRGLMPECLIEQKHYLNESMIADLLAGGMSIGSHGMHHRDWRPLNGKGSRH
jgi:hypothetical protein